MVDYLILVARNLLVGKCKEFGYYFEILLTTTASN